MKPTTFVLSVSLCFLLFSCSGDKENDTQVKKKADPPEWNKSFTLNNAIPQKDTLLVKYTPKFPHQAHGYPVVTENYDSSGKAVSKTTTIFDTRGNLVENSTQSKDSGLSAKTFYRYDTKGNVIESVVKKNGKTVKSIYKYDAKGNQVEQDIYNDSALTSRTINTYNDKGKNTSSITTNAFGKLKLAAKKQYSDDGTLYKYMIISRGKGIITKDTYNDTDRNNVGNWLKKTETWNDTTNAFTMRTVE